LAGVLLAWAINCKPPLGIFFLPVLAAGYRPGVALRKQLMPLLLVLTGIVLGVLSYKLYDWYKFPPGESARYEEELKNYADVWTWNPFPGMANLALSLSAGAPWYCPTLLLSYYGWRRWRLNHKHFCQAALAACGVLFLFVCFLPFFKGEPTWGPRYLTPAFALGWVFAPAAAEVKSRLYLKVILGLGMVIQLLGLSIDPLRLFLEAPMPIGYYLVRPWLGFHPATSHLVQRPREIVRAVRSWGETSPHFSCGPLPTHAGRIGVPEGFNIASSVGLMAAPQEMGAGIAFLWNWKAGMEVRFQFIYQEAVHYYQIFNSLRPWWAAQWHLPAEERPVDLERTLKLLGVLSALGLGLMLVVGRNVPGDQPA
jgi:hypothetical protein